MGNPFVANAGADIAPAEPVRTKPVAGPKRLAKGSEQQEALWAALMDGDTHILSEARAGSGKTSSNREGMWRMLDRKPSLSIRYAVFNAQNAKEFEGDCPPGVDVGTVHRYGYQALQKACRSQLEKQKTYLILDQTPEGARLPRWLRRAIAMLVGHAKNQGVMPADLDTPDITERLKALIAHYDINAYKKEDWIVRWAINVLRSAAAWPEIVDFDDMIWLPSVLQLPFPAVDALFLDEVQDWNPAQHALIPLMMQSGRIVAVGDRYQSIYGFRGADIDSIPRLEAGLSQRPEGLTRLPLTITWRCPASHVRLAQQYVSDIQARPNAPEGVVAEMDLPEAIGEFRPGDMVLCGANAPLVEVALKLIASRQRCVVRGRAVGDQLLNVWRNLPNPSTVAEAGKAIEDWKGRELSRLEMLDNADDLIEQTIDRADGLTAVLSSCRALYEVEPTIQSLFSDDASADSSPGAVVFSTIHRAKGLESHNVFLLSAPTRAPKRQWEVDQARNLRYVALTRAKHSLTFVHLPNK